MKDRRSEKQRVFDDIGMHAMANGAYIGTLISLASQIPDEKVSSTLIIAGTPPFVMLTCKDVVNIRNNGKV